MTHPILILDDDRSVVTLVEKVIASFDLEYVSFTESVPAMEYFKANRCELAIVDLHLPEISGTDVIRIIKGVNSFTRIVAMTGCAPVNTLLDCWRLGADCCVLKGGSFVPDMKEAITNSLQIHTKWKQAIDKVRKSVKV